MLRRIRTPAVVILLLAMIAAGCGGGGDDSASDGGDNGRAASEATTPKSGGGEATESGGTDATEAGGTGSIEATTVTDSSFDADVLGSDRPVLVYFWAEWCGPCRLLAPQLEEVAGEHQDKLTVARLNVDDNPETPGRYEVKSIPTLVLFVDGVEKSA
jgi:thioredoxin